LALINFKQPDAAGHANDSLAYLQGIIDTDNYIYQLWQQIQSDSIYKDKTTLIVTNDHGRHSAGHLDGFVSHGDDCDGCRHIEFFALGPDFKQNYTCSRRYEQIDIANTIAELLSFSMPSSNGKVMRDLFKN
jgi:phosphopentomutase